MSRPGTPSRRSESGAGHREANEPCDPWRPMAFDDAPSTSRAGDETREASEVLREIARMRRELEEQRNKTQNAPRPHPEAGTSTARPAQPASSGMLRELEDLRRMLQEQERTNQRLLQSGIDERRVRSSTRHASAWDEWGDLSRSQVAARHVAAGKLPKFSGNPEDWGNFKSRFETSTRMCGYSDDENTIRLQESLSGRALKAVQCRLYNPENVREVMETLERMFGQPETIIGNIIRQIRQAPAPKLDRLQSVIDYGIAVEELCATVKNSGLHEYTYNATLLQELVDRLPPTLRLEWGRRKMTLPHSGSLKHFGVWMKETTDAAIAVTPPVQATNGRVFAHHEPSDDDDRHSDRCPMCEKPSCEKGPRCDAFISKNINDRWNLVRLHKLCRTCLHKHNGKCRKDDKCTVDDCGRFHHTLLHDTSGKANAPVHTHTSDPDTLLRYAPVILHGQNGATVRTYALLDEGSSVTLMDRSLIDELMLHGQPSPLCLSWTGDLSRNEDDSVTVTVGISGSSENAKVYEIRRARTVKKLSLQEQTLEAAVLSNDYEHLSDVKAESYDNARPRILIGMDNYHLTYPLKVAEGRVGEPIATKTRLGWVIGGSRECVLPSEAPLASNVHNCRCEEFTIAADDAIRRCFTALDDCYQPKEKLISSENARALAILQSSTKLNDTRFETALLWRSDDVKLPNNREMAIKRLECLERRMQRDPRLGEAVKEKIRDYLAKGYVRKCTLEELRTKEPLPRKWFLPIFTVTNPNKPGKVRLVWDAAAAVRGVSLNSKLLTGPDLLCSLPAVLYKFRENLVAVAVDIKEMYHQVVIAKDDEQSQRFLWRWGNQSAPPEEYVMTRMTFGASCSPSCAQYVKNLNAERFAERFPEAVRCIKEQHYVDDMLASTDCEREAITLAKQVEHIHQQGGFQLHNWLSNSAAFMSAFDKDSGTAQRKAIDGSQHSSTDKILGMWWDRDTDTFGFKLNSRRKEEMLRVQKQPTKRQLLSILMSLFDPLGLIAGYLLYLKVLLQDVWRAGTGWDEPIPTQLQSRWERWRDGLPAIEKLRIPRCYRLHPHSAYLNTQLHIFVDAGQDGYAAVAYLRFRHENKVEISLIGAKAKVAPLKYVSVPRLELQAAVLGARLAKSIVDGHRVSVDSEYLWTDSRDVMCWLHADHRRYSAFVAPRIAEVLELTAIGNWRWVPTKLNVADECTKWSNLEQHLQMDRWLGGPNFLREEEGEWPTAELPKTATSEEMKRSVTTHVTRAPIVQWERFSRWSRLLRTVAYVRRFVRNARRPPQRSTGPLTSDELKEAEALVLREVQRQTYPEASIQANANAVNIIAKRGSPLHKRKPYMDEDGLIRMRGRIDECSFADPAMKRPIILPKDGTVVELIVADYHRKFHHTNHETVVNELRLKYDIPALRRAVRRVRNNCAYCILKSRMPENPEMAPLPAARLAAYERPFTFTGIDYFGPFTVTTGRNRTEKRWGVLFTCLTIRAIHIEVTASLSTDACIMALRSFTARRGTPNEIYSDRGTNFTGASKELAAAAKQVDRSALIAEINLPNMTWHFNPPAAPHFGGAWERMIGTVKRVLSKIEFDRLPTDAVLRNVLIEAEGMINMRPLTHVPLDRDDEAPLTPNHFLLGSSSGVKPLVLPGEAPPNLKNTWKTAQQANNRIWARWIKTYLPTIRKPSKWFDGVRPMEVGNIVLIVDENHPRNCWPRGIVVEVSTSKDGTVRRATVTTAKGTRLERPVSKLVTLTFAHQDVQQPQQSDD